MVRSGMRGDQRVYDRATLRVAMREADRRYAERRAVAGPGRGRVNSSLDDGILF